MRSCQATSGTPPRWCDNDRAVHSRVEHEQVLGEVVAAPELGKAQVNSADARAQRPLALVVHLVAVGAGVLSLGVYDFFDERLGHHAQQLLDVGHAVVESGKLGHCCGPML